MAEFNLNDANSNQKSITNPYLEIIERLDRIEKNQNIVNLSPTYNSEDVMNHFGISKRTLQNWRDKMYINFSKINGKIRYTQEDINECIAKNRK